MNKYIFGTLILFSFHAKAGFLFSLDLFGSQDSLATPSSYSRTQTYFDAKVLLSTSTSMRYFLGAWVSSYGSTEDSAGTPTTFTSQDYFIGGKVYIGRKKGFSLTAGYSLLSTANYKTGSAANEVWQGTATVFKAGYDFEISERTNFVLSLGYYGGSYSRKDVSAVSSTFSGTKSFISPLVGFNFSF